MTTKNEPAMTARTPGQRVTERLLLLDRCVMNGEAVADHVPWLITELRAALNRIQELEGEVIGSDALYRTQMEMHYKHRARAEAAEQALARARQFIQHKPICVKWITTIDGSYPEFDDSLACTCGLDTALAAPEQKDE